MEYKLEERNPERLQEITRSIRGLGTLFDILDLYTLPETHKGFYGENIVGKGTVKVSAIFDMQVYLVHLLVNPKADIAAFLFNAWHQSCADDVNKRVVGLYDGKKEMSKFAKFMYGEAFSGIYKRTERLYPITELKNFKGRSRPSVDITYRTSRDEETKTVRF
ncbi:hypothetical protein ACFL0V_01790 [Nanoarchaeota archaeon]